MTRAAILLVPLSLLCCASAVAQVAAPSLVPASPGLAIFAQYSRAEKDDPANKITESASASLGLVYQC